MNNADNLKPWKPGQSGNPSGRPKGARSWHTVINELLRDEELLHRLADNGLIGEETIRQHRNALELIAAAQIVKAVDGDWRAAEWLRKIECEASPGRPQ